MEHYLINNHEISKENLKAIKKAESMGVHFVIATGRTFEDVKPLLDEYNLNCQCIVLNGAEYRDRQGNIVEGIYVDKSKVKEILNIVDYNRLLLKFILIEDFTLLILKKKFNGCCIELKLSIQKYKF